jgi:hypothetical protein
VYAAGHLIEYKACANQHPLCDWLVVLKLWLKRSPIDERNEAEYFVISFSKNGGSLLGEHVYATRDRSILLPLGC